MRIEIGQIFQALRGYHPISTSVCYRRVVPLPLP
jgi:hypothetical protein